MSEAVERVARNSYSRLVAWLAYQWRDVAAAEDALGDALLAALQTWPQTGVPASPEAWLLTTAKRQLLQVARHRRVVDAPEVLAAVSELTQAHVEATASVPAAAVPEARLNLMFVCAHPAIAPKVHTALMLQTVLGLNASDIAPAMLMSPAALAQRLVRAKQKIREARLRFELPEARELPERTHGVLEAIYAAYGLAWDTVVDGGEARVTSLRDEALYLARVLCELQPNSAEAMGLASLIEFCEARAGARVHADGAFVPLAAQDTARWDRALIIDANQRLWQAARLQVPGPFQLEAAIGAAHCQRLFTGETPWNGIAKLYGQLVRIAPSAGALVAHAVAVTEAGDAPLGKHMLSELRTSPDTAAMMTSYQPWWVAMAHVEASLHDLAASRAALQTALGLTTQPSLRRYLQGKLAKLG